MKKRTKIILVGIATFLIFLLVALIATNFFSLFQPPYKEGEYFKSSDDLLTEQKIKIENGSLEPSEVLIPKGKFLGLKVYNKDNSLYRLLILRKEGDSRKIIYEYFIKSGEEKQVYAFYSDISMHDLPEKVRQERKHIIMDDKFALIYKADQCTNSDECVLTCANCRGAQVQVKVNVEK